MVDNAGKLQIIDFDRYDFGDPWEDMKSITWDSYSCRFIKAALNLYPGIRYSYSCGADNYASMAATKKSGFVFEGTYDFLS